MFRNLLRRLGMWLIRLTAERNMDIYVRFQCKDCKSYQVGPVPRMFSWSGPRFQCWGCNRIIDHVTCELVTEGDVNQIKPGYRIG